MSPKRSVEAPGCPDTPRWPLPQPQPIVSNASEAVSSRVPIALTKRRVPDGDVLYRQREVGKTGSSRDELQVIGGGCPSGFVWVGMIIHPP